MKLTKEMLIDWIDRPPSNSDLDLINYIIGVQNNRDKAIEILGQYKHYSTPTEEQNSENEDIVDNAYNILKGDSDDK